MGRAQGKHPRRGILAELEAELGIGSDNRPPTEGEQREAGIGDTRDIPGGISHNDANPAVVPVPGYAKPAEWRYRKDLAHGVYPDEAGHHDRQHDAPGYKSGGHAELERDAPKPLPVPVYLVERAGEADTIRTASPRSIQCPASTAAEPVRVCGVNHDRIEIQLLNESTSSDIRFSHDLGALAAGTGALLPWPSNSYVTIKTQDELFAVSADSGTPRLSIIEVFQGEAGK